MSSNAYLALLLDAPLQSWGFASRFQRRTTGLHPTKSGVIGLICAAMGHAKRSVQEDDLLRQLAALKMTTIAIPRHEVRRLEDFHTVAFTREASATQKRIAELQRKSVIPISAKDRLSEITPTRRQYLLDARFGVILSGEWAMLDLVAAALQDPVWGIWLGRKNCIPAAPVCVGLSKSQDDVWKAVLKACRLDEGLPLEVFTTVSEVERFDEDADSLADQPVSFGDGMSSGSDKRQFAVRRIRVQPGTGLSVKE